MEQRECEGSVVRFWGLEARLPEGWFVRGRVPPSVLSPGGSRGRVGMTGKGVGWGEIREERRIWRSWRAVIRRVIGEA